MIKNSHLNILTTRRKCLPESNDRHMVREKHISNSSVRFAIHYNLQDMYMHTRPPFVLQGMVALPSFIILDFCVCNFNLVWSDFSSAELWLLVDTHHDTRIKAEVSAILTFMHAKLAQYGECLLTQQNTLHHQLEGRFPICLGGIK